ncbi:MAG: DUF72 domain-containing protein [Bacteroidales bacterium]|nr:DUF72 domain-containing protein [Bacteroidales bacterium]
MNNTFYRFPDEKSISGWKNRTPPGFRFTVKANRYFTHVKKLRADTDFKDSLYRFFKEISLLGEKLCCILWQLPGNLRMDIQRLEKFIGLLNSSFNHVIEFRHPSWFNKDVYNLMCEQNISFCMISAPDLPEDIITTNRIGYVRFHGRTNWYRYLYTADELQKWKNQLISLPVEELYIYFNNDVDANSVTNAYQLIDMFR